MKPASRRATWLSALAIFFAVTAPAQGPTNAPATLADLQQRIAGIIEQPRYGAALWGVKIVSLDTHQTVFELNAGKLFVPASNTKLYTMAMVLDRLGPDHRILTSLYAKTRPNWRGTLKGDLIIYGRGDPTINERLHGDDIFRALEPLVSALTNAGVRRVNGDLIGDDSYFRGPPFGASWDWDDLQHPYGAEISALTINDNVLGLMVTAGDRVGTPCRVWTSVPARGVAVSNLTTTVTAGAERHIDFYRPLVENVIYVTGQLPLGDTGEFGKVTVHNPANLFASLFKDALARHGIKVSGRVRTMNWLDRVAAPVDLKLWTELGAVESPPVRELLPEVLKPSQNLYTDLLLAHTAMVRQGDRPLDAGETSEQAGMRALRDFLTEAGVAPAQTQFDEGSGLSRNNLTTPDATVTLLQFMRRHRDWEIYYGALPVAGGPGTLDQRMTNTPAVGNIHAKTGTTEWANALSGYVTTAAGEHLVFSLMLNRFYNTDPDRPKTADLDAIAVMLAGFTGRTGP